MYLNYLSQSAKQWDSVRDAERFAWHVGQLTGVEHSPECDKMNIDLLTQKAFQTLTTRYKLTMSVPMLRRANTSKLSKGLAMKLSTAPWSVEYRPISTP